MWYACTRTWQLFWLFRQLIYSRYVLQNVNESTYALTHILKRPVIFSYTRFFGSYPGIDVLFPKCIVYNKHTAAMSYRYIHFWTFKIRILYMTVLIIVWHSLHIINLRTSKTEHACSLLLYHANIRFSIVLRQFASRYTVHEVILDIA